MVTASFVTIWSLLWLHVEPFEVPPSTENKRKLTCYGHVTRSIGLAKTSCEALSQEDEREGEGDKWEDKVQEYTGLT